MSMPTHTITASLFRHCAYLMPLLGVLLFSIGTLLRATFMDVSDQDYGLMGDHFIASVVAKNIAQGYGWVTTGYEAFPLNPESLNTGPTIVVPMALAIGAFGNQLAVTGLAMAALNILLLFGLLYQSRRYWPEPSQHFLFMLGTLTLFTVLWPHGWYRAGGEVTSALLLANAALLLARHLRQDQQLSWKAAAGAGFMAGLAGTSKQLALLGCLGLATAAWLLVVLQQRTAWRQSLLLCLAMALPYALFMLYQHLFARSLDPVWWAGTEFYRTQLFERYSGLIALKRYLDPETPLWSAVSNTFMNNVKTVQGHWVSTSVWPTVWWLWPPLWLASLWLAWQQRQHNPLIGLLLAAALPLLIWFFLLATASSSRYIVIALYLSALGCLAATSSLAPLLRTATGMVMPILLLCSNASVHGWETHPRSLGVSLSWPTQTSTFSQATRDLHLYLEAHPELPVSMGAYWTINQLEYLSSRRNIHTNLLDEIARHAVFDEEAYQGAHPEVRQWIAEGRYKSGREHFLHPETAPRYHGRFRLVEEVQINVLLTYNIPASIESLPACHSAVYGNALYLIVRCNNQDIEKLMSNTLSVRPQIWMRPQRIYPNENEFF